jgi:HEAT repeat protein
MKTIYRSLMLLAPLALLAPAHSAEPKLPRDGWVSWQVPAVENAPAWCCWGNGRTGNLPAITCPLDRADGFGVGDRDSTTDMVKVYARSAGGKIDRLQVLAASCPVETNAPVQELGGVEADDSARWLVAQARQESTNGLKRRSIGEQALAALAMHAGAVARDSLAAFARDTRAEMRKSAVFWLAMLRGEEGAEITSAMMFNDQEAEVRKHAAFAMAQTRSSRAATDLIRQGNTDKVGDVRAQAWFWLAQSEAAAAETAIAAALRKDSDEHVREQAVFALSQLPDERATRALIATAEDQSLPREQRKRAVFWLSHSESDSAQAYLEKVLARNAVN